MPTRTELQLPAELRESSGVAVSLRHPGIYWTHNDSGPGVFAVDDQGGLVGRFQMATTVRDWEDLSLSTCPDGGSCLYAADLGDNYELRDAGTIAIHRFPEPDPATAGASAALPVESFPLRLPDGARDVEALLVFPGERVFVVTKGRNHPVTVYRYPGELRPDTVTLVEVQQLTERPRFLSRQITGGAVDPIHGIAALRTYQNVQFYRLDGDTLAAVPDGRIDLGPYQEGQGEGVGLGSNGVMALTSEGGAGGRRAAGLTLLRCSLEAAAAPTG